MITIMIIIIIMADNLSKKYIVCTAPVKAKQQCYRATIFMAHCSIFILPCVLVKKQRNKIV